MKKYLLFVCLPAAFLTLAGIVLLFMVREQTVASLLAVYGRDAYRAVRTVSPMNAAEASACRFYWTKSRGLAKAGNLPAGLKTALSSTNVLFVAEGRKTKTPKIGWMRLGGETIVWRRLQDDSVAGLVIEPFEDSAAGQKISLFAVGMVLVALLAALILAGGYNLWRGMERERFENAEKTSFLTNATHELKTPLAAIRLWSEMLAEGRLKPDRAQHAAEVIEEENARMIRLVENLLDFSRLEQKRRQYREEDVDARRLVEECVELMRADFSKHGISVAGDDAVQARLDADAVRQVLVNLLSNAAKYASAGGPVEVAVSRNGGKVVVSVSDRGPGMTAAERARAFDRFFRGAAAEGTPGGGLGLGLAISRGLARGMGGDLVVSPRDGGGLVFTFEVPARCAEDC